MKSTAAGSESALATLLEHPEPLTPDAELTVASARLRQSSLPALPVVERGRVVGVLTDRALVAGLASWGRGVGACRDWLQPATSVPVTAPVEDVLWLLRRDDVDLLTVLDSEQRYLGVVCRRRLMDALEDARRPRIVGGMATPLGVHLTTLHHRGGVGDVALVLSGLVMAILLQVARVVVATGSALLSHDPMLGFWQQASDAFAALRVVPPVGDVGQSLVLLPVFLTLLRLSPLAGYHSGEHQTVHALERGVPLVYDQVAQQPRPHVRCGTNLLVLLTLAGLLVALLQQGQLLGAGLVLIGLLNWRRLGAVVQQGFTTKPATRRQLEAGITAAKMLLQRYQRQPNYRARWWVRLWNRGLIQVVGGLLLGAWIAGPLLNVAGWLALHL